MRELADVALDLFDEYGPTFRACVLFAAWVGLRPAELFVLTWDDVEGDELVISKSLGSTGEVTRPPGATAFSRAQRSRPTLAPDPEHNNRPVVGASRFPRSA